MQLYLYVLLFYGFTISAIYLSDEPTKYFLPVCTRIMIIKVKETKIVFYATNYRECINVNGERSTYAEGVDILRCQFLRKQSYLSFVKRDNWQH